MRKSGEWEGIVRGKQRWNGVRKGVEAQAKNKQDQLLVTIYSRIKLGPRSQSLRLCSTTSRLGAPDTTQILVSQMQ